MSVVIKIKCFCFQSIIQRWWGHLLMGANAMCLRVWGKSLMNIKWIHLDLMCFSVYLELRRGLLVSIVFSCLIILGIVYLGSSFESLGTARHFFLIFWDSKLEFRCCWSNFSSGGPASIPSLTTFFENC